MSIKLRAGTMALAIKIQESMDSGDSLSANDIRNRLNDALNDQYRGSGHWAYLIDSFGDAESGDVIYSCDGDTFRASYEMSGGAGAQKCIIDFDHADDVVPRTVYETEEDEGDHMAAMEALQKEKLYGAAVPMYERFVSKSERDKAGTGDFAGKGKSFPILKAADVSAAASSIGRAGSGNYSTDVIKKNIIRIAKAKGWSSELPKAWQGGEDDSKDSKESRRIAREAKKPMKDCADCKGSGDCPTCDGDGKTGKGDAAKDCADCDGSGDCDACDGDGKVPVFAKKESQSAQQDPSAVSLIESADIAQYCDFAESAATAAPLLKIISPGRGSSGWYSKEALQQAAEDKVFARGTLGYFNHATKAEEAARPEGDWNKLAYVTTGDAYWDEAGRDGAALYAPVKIFAKHAEEIAEKAPHTGASIRASGTRDDKAIAPDGKPGVITKLLHAESIDLVTKAGRDGKLLLESADSNLTEGGDMDANALKKLQEANQKIFKGFATGKAREFAAKTLQPIRLPEAAKLAVVERACADVPITEDGDFDEPNFKKALEAEIQYAAAFLPAGVKVEGLGTAAPDPKVIEAQREKTEANRSRAMNRSASNLGIATKEGQRIFREGRAAFNPNYCAPKVQEVEA